MTRPFPDVYAVVDSDGECWAAANSHTEAVDRMWYAWQGDTFTRAHYDALRAGALVHDNGDTEWRVVRYRHTAPVAAG